MTPKEKAIELVDKFCEYSHTEFIPQKGGYQKDSQIKNAKQCAFICVDEILNEYWSHDCNRRDWWKQVKEEINKL